MQVIELCHGLSSCCRVSLEISRNCLDMFLSSLLWVSLLELRLEQVDPEFPAGLSHAVTL